MKLDIKHDFDHTHLKNLNMNKNCNFFLKIFNINEKYYNETDSINKYDNLIKHSS